VEAGAVHTVLGAHLFTRGGRESESERIFLGTAEQVDAGLFAGFDSVALGHLHRFQKAGANAWYSGSPLAYSFDEASDAVSPADTAGPDQGKVFLSVELTPGAPPAVTPIPVKPLRNVRRLWGSFNFFFRDSAGDPAIREAAKDYLEITLDDADLVENPMPLLRPRFPFLLSIHQGAAFARLAQGTLPQAAAEETGAKHSPVEDFAEFLTSIYDEVDGDKLDLFRELLAEQEAEEDQ
jgi:exonuclease SbcD